MHRLRAYVGRHPLWLGFVAAVLPLVALLVLQYLWLAKLQKTSAIAQMAYLNHFLEAVATRVEYSYRSAAERSLNLPASLLRDLDPDAVARHFRKRPFPGARELFVVHFLADNRGELLFYDPYQRTMVSRPEPSDDLRAISAACAPLAILRYESSPLDSVTPSVNEQDPGSRIIVSPVTDDAYTLVGIAGAVVDERFFAQTLLPREMSDSLDAFFPDSKGDLIVTVRRASGEVVYASAPAGETAGSPDEMSRPFPFVFKDWSVGIRTRGLTPQEWARVSFGINMTLAGLLALVLVGGIALAFRAASREIRLSEMKSNFVSNVSHELRTPLASIRVFGELLRLGRAQQPEKIREYGEYIEGESRRLTQLINNILDFSRIESGRKTYLFEVADVAGIVAEVLRTFEVTLRHSGFAVELERTATEPLLAAVDREAVAQALMNLLDNAVKYSGDSRRVVVRLGRERQRVAIAVRDFGVGIAASEQSRIFERFHRISTGLVHDVKGSGLGLSIVDHIVKAHGGKVEVESAPGRGSTFTILLPAPPATEAEEPQRAAFDSPGLDPAGKR